MNRSDKKPGTIRQTPLPDFSPAARPSRTTLMISALLAFALVGYAATGVAEDAARSFTVPAQALSGALTEFADQADLKLAADAALLHGLASPGVTGSFTPAEGLASLLAGTGMTYRFTGPDAVTIERLDPLADLVARAGIRPDYAQVTEPEKPKAPPPKKDDEGPTVLPEITVTASPLDETSYNVPNATTATKTDTPILETPLNIQVVPQQVLKDQQAVRIDKALENVSGVYPDIAGLTGFQATFSLRGFNTSDYYRDGVRVNSGGFTPDRETANVERLEVLKGPASILYGRLEPGGLINVVTKQPLASRYHALEQQFGSFDFYRTTIDTTGPITQDDSLLYRFNLAYENQGSFIDFLDKERVFLAPVLRWNITPQTQMNFYLEYQHSDAGVNTFGNPLLGNAPSPLVPGSSLVEPGTEQNTDDVRIGFNWSHAFNEQWTLRHRFDAEFIDFPQTVEFVPISDGFRDGQCTRNQCTVDRRGQESPLNQRQDYYTIVDLTGKFDTWGLQHTLLLGGDYWHEHSRQRFRGFLAPSIEVVDFRPVHVPGLLPTDLTIDLDAELGEDWYGFFFQDQVKLPYGFHLLAGFRYDNAGTEIDIVDLTPGAGNARFTDSQREDSLKPRFGLLWQPVPELSLYGNYVENFGLTNGRGIDAPLPPTTAEQWEVGLKSELFDGRLTGTLAWFNLTKQNIATSNPDPQLAAQGFQVVTGEVRNRGLELDIAGELWPGLRAISSYAYIDSEVTQDVGLDFDPVTGEIIGTNSGNTGRRLCCIPRHGGSFWMTYEPQEGDLRGLKLGAGVVARGSQTGDNEDTFRLPGHALVNLMAGYTWKVGPSKVSAQLNIDNLLDKETINAMGSSRFTQFGAPRTFLGSLRVEF